MMMIYKGRKHQVLIYFAWWRVQASQKRDQDCSSRRFFFFWRKSSGLQKWGATSTIQAGSTSMTLRMYSLVVITSSWQTTHSGWSLCSIELGWIRTFISDLVVLQTSSRWLRAQLAKKALAMHLRMLVLRSSSKMDSSSLLTSISTRSSSPVSWSLMSLARRRDRTWMKFSVHHWLLYSYSFHELQTLRRARWSPPGRKKVFLALSACIFLSLGRKKTLLPTESMAQMVMIWSMHLQASDLISILESMGSRGNSAILRPRTVSWPVWLRAPRAQSISSPLTSMSCGGGSRKSNSTRLSMPMLLSIRITLEMLLRWISGMVDSSSSLSQLQSVYSRKHFPGAVRPALPARWLAEALLTGTTMRLSSPLRGLQAVCLTKPQSMTQMMLSMVSEVSAMLVASTHLREPLGVGSNILACMSVGSPEQMGRTISSLTLLPSPFMRLLSSSCTSSISSCPVKKQRMSPLSWVRWICRMVTIEASAQLASGLEVQQMSTGNRLPGMQMIGALLKNSANFQASRVAEEITTFISGRYRATSLIRVSRMSVCSDRSWASSTIITEQEARSGSIRNSRSSMPSVMYLMKVFSLVLSSNRTAQPTSSPSLTSISSLTRLATLMAATRRGWVQPILPCWVQPSSCRNWGSWVVLPDPVSPTMMMIWLFLIRFISSSRCLKIGSDYLTNSMGVLWALIFSSFCFTFVGFSQSPSPSPSAEEEEEELLSSSSCRRMSSCSFLALLAMSCLMNFMGLLITMSQLFLALSSISSMVRQAPLVFCPWCFSQALSSGNAFGTSSYRPQRALVFLSFLGFRSSSAVSCIRQPVSSFFPSVFLVAQANIFYLRCLILISLMESSSQSNISFQSWMILVSFWRISCSLLSRYLSRDCILRSGRSLSFSSSVSDIPLAWYFLVFDLSCLSFSASRRDSSFSSRASLSSAIPSYNRQHYNISIRGGQPQHTQMIYLIWIGLYHYRQGDTSTSPSIDSLSAILSCIQKHTIISVQVGRHVELAVHRLTLQRNAHDVLLCVARLRQFQGAVAHVPRRLDLPGSRSSWGLLGSRYCLPRPLPFFLLRRLLLLIRNQPLHGEQFVLEFGDAGLPVVLAVGAEVAVLGARLLALQQGGEGEVVLGGGVELGGLGVEAGLVIRDGCLPPGLEDVFFGPFREVAEGDALGVGISGGVFFAVGVVVESGEGGDCPLLAGLVFGVLRSPHLIVAARGNGLVQARLLKGQGGPGLKYL